MGDRLFLKVDGVEGAANDPGVTGSIPVQSYSWTQDRPLDSSAKVIPKDFTVVLYLEKATPALLRKIALRERTTKMTLTVRNSLGSDYLKWTLGDVLITSFNVQETAGDERAMVTLTLNMAKIDVEYRQQLGNGGLSPAVRGGWELR